MNTQDLADMVWELGTGLNRMGSEPGKRWVACEECDSQGFHTIRLSEREEKCDTCDDGYVQVEPTDERWESGTTEHPHDYGKRMNKHER